MPKFVTIGYGDQSGYDRTAPDVRAAAHAHDDKLKQRGALMGIAGAPVLVRNPDAAGVQTQSASFMSSSLPIAGFAVIVREADLLVVTKPDRLARSTAELLTIEAALTKRGSSLVILSMGGERLDTRNPTSKLMLTILAGVATWEREIMLERQREGIAKAKAEGKYKGRPVSIEAASIRALVGTMGPAAIAKQLGIARSSVYRVLGAEAAS